MSRFNRDKDTGGLSPWSIQLGIRLLMPELQMVSCLDFKHFVKK